MHYKFQGISYKRAKRQNGKGESQKDQLNLITYVLCLFLKCQMLNFN
jgi:hypothetical protein